MAYPIHHMTNQATNVERITLKTAIAKARRAYNFSRTKENETLLRNLRLAAQALADSTGCTVTVRNDHGVLVYETE